MREAYRFFASSRKFNGISTATPTLSPEKQAFADGIMEELEVYREKQGIVPRTNSTETAVIRSQEADANRTVPTKQTKQPTSSALHRSFSTDDGGNASLRNVGTPQNASASLDMQETERYNWRKKITSIWETVLRKRSRSNKNVADAAVSVDLQKPYRILYYAKVVGGRSRSSHRYHANQQFYARLQTDETFKKQMGALLGFDVMAYMESGKGALRNPSPELVWHHPIDDPYALELVYKKDHEDPAMQKVFHPNRQGGYSKYHKYVRREQYEGTK